MDNISESVLRRFEKVLALAKGGIAGERAAAQSQIEKMLAKYGIALDVLCSAGAPIKYEIQYSGLLERRLLVQIAATVLDTETPNLYKRKGSKSTLIIDLTPAQHAEVVVTFEALKIALNKEVQRAFVAFLHVNQLFPKTQSACDNDLLTPEQRAENRRTMMMAQFMGRTQVHRALPN